MFEFSSALGVNCIHCHVADDFRDFSTYNFSSDENVNKKKARLMIKLVQTSNRNTMKEIAALSEKKDQAFVVCRTCHRGYKTPVSLEEVIYGVIKKTGVQSGIEEYNKLREKYYGKGTFNFDDNALNKVGYKLLGEKAVQDAISVFKLNTEVNPESPNSFDSLGDAYVEAGDYKNAVESAEKCIDLLDNVIKKDDSFNNTIRKSAMDKIEKYKGK